MLEKPALADNLVCSFVQKEYALQIDRLAFLPLGYDVHTAVYRLEASDGKLYFLKLRKGDFDPITVVLPQFLCQQGLTSIISPLETSRRQLFATLDEYTFILYPFVTGQNGYQVKLTSQQWIQLGYTLRLVHQAQPPLKMSVQIPRETYDPQWRVSVREFLGRLPQETITDPIARDLSGFMLSHHEVISHLVRRADELAKMLTQQPIDFVLCHSDAHPGNYLVAHTGELYLVDWDNPVFAPKEHDLMCIGSGMSGSQPGGSEEQFFYQGYGDIPINWTALAYYRFERIIQDIAEFCKQILLVTSGSKDRSQAFQYFTSLFLPGAEVDVAIKTGQLAMVRP